MPTNTPWKSRLLLAFLAKGVSEILVAMDPNGSDTAFVVSKLEEVGLGYVNSAVQTLDQWRDALRGKIVLIVGGREVVNDDVLKLADGLRLVQRYGIGFDRIDLRAAGSHGIYVCNVQEVLAETTAQHAWALIMSLSKKIVEADRAIRSKHWGSGKLGDLVGVELWGKTLGIIGLGAIGKRIARIGHAFNMNMLTYHPRMTKMTAQLHGVSLVESLDVLLQESDIVVLSIPLSDETRRMIGERELGLMKRTAYLVNVSRGGIVEEDELVEGLKTGKIAGAGIDVFEKEPLSSDSPFIALENVVLTPHIGSWSAEAKTRQAEEMVANIKRFLSGRTPRWIVNAEFLREHGFKQMLPRE